MLEQLAVMISPIIPHMAEDVWQNLPYTPTCKSVFQKGWIGHSSTERFPEHLVELWEKIRLVRNDVNRCIELARQAKHVGASQECKVWIHSADPAFAEVLNAMRGDDTLLAHPVATNGIDDLRFVLMTSQVQVMASGEQVAEACPSYRLAVSDTESGVTVGITKAEGAKCDRCWYYSESVGQSHDHSDICLRCDQVIKTDSHKV
jgi:isoleucyl-tRNA synthetase